MATLCVREIGEVPEHARLRAADAAECLLVGMEPEEALAYSINGSFRAFVGDVDGEPVAYWGYSPISVLGDTAFVWMLSTEALSDNPIVCAMASRRILGTLLERYPTLLAQVDLRYERAIRWLEWLGFVPGDVSGGLQSMKIQRGRGWAH